MMKGCRLVAVGLVMFASMLTHGATQTITGSYWWKSGATMASSGSSVFNPTQAVVTDRTTATIKAKPGDGLKAVAWYRWKKTTLHISNFEKLCEGDSLVWSYDGSLGTSVPLGLELDWIAYSLRYESGSTTSYLYTNEISIADCTTTENGYVFGGVWTNAAGQAFQTGRMVTGADFGITNHNDEARIVLYPKWMPRSYQVTLDRQGGVGGSEQVTATYDQISTRIVVPTRTGYSFDGYFTQPNGSGTRYYEADGTTSRIWHETTVTCLFANWKVNRFTVGIVAEGNGTARITPAGGTYDYGQVVKIAATSDNEGTVFAGWSDGSLENPRDVTVTSNATYVANFLTKSFRVAWTDNALFDSRLLKEEFVQWGKNATKPDTPAHDGYTFSGWTEDGKDIRANTTIVATYSANQYIVWMDKNDGIESPQRDFRTYTYGTEGSLPPNKFVRTGYAFQGWGTNRTDSTVIHADCAQVWNWATGGSVTVYAVWKPNEYVVRFDSGEGSGTMDDQDFIYDLAQPMSENLFTCGDRTFIGWKGSDNRTYADCQTVSNLTAEADGVVVLTAQWSTTIHVAFDGNGATNEQAMAIQDFNGPDDEQNLVSNRYGRVGYTFVGWATNREDAAAQKIVYHDGERVKIKGSAGSTLMLFASWSANTYYIAFNPGEGREDAPLAIVEATYDTAFELPDANGHYSPMNPDLDGFDYWVDVTNETTYVNRATVSNLCAVADATNVLTAAWKLDVGEWSERMQCTTLRWKQSEIREGGEPQWSRNGLVSQVGGGWGSKEWLQATVRTNGTLKLSCRLNGSEGDMIGLAVGFVSDEDDAAFNWTESGLFATNILIDTANEWISVSVSVRVRAEESKVVIRLVNSSIQGDALVEVNEVSWMPEGTEPGIEPKEGEDNPVVQGVSVRNGKIVIESTSDARFAYRILQSPSLTLPVTWTVREGSYQDGQEGAQTFELPIDPGMPQMFYKVEVLKRRE